MRISRYQIFRELARGGMGTVHLARTAPSMGVSRVVAVKRLHPHLAGDPTFVRMFLDEARLCARIRHRNVVSLLDLVQQGDELCMVLEYVEGETLGKLVPAGGERGSRVPDAIVAGVVSGALHGLHAAHEAKSEDGTPLGIVHRDFTPQNVIVGVDGVARVADFGVAKAVSRLQTTREGQLKGKLGYMSPEQIQGHAVDRRTDIFAAGAVLWEMLTGRRLFHGESEGHILLQILRGQTDPPSDLVPGLDPKWDAITERALALSPERRFATAREMAMAIESSFPSATVSEIGEWVSSRAEESLQTRAAWVAEVERAPFDDEGAAVVAPPPAPSGAQAAATPPGSQISQITALETPRALARRSSGIVAPAVGVALAALVAVAALMWSRAPGDAAGVSSAAGEASTSPSTVSAAPPTAPPAATSSDVASPGAAPSSSSSQGPATTAPPSASAPAPGPPRGRPVAAPRPSPSSPACRYFDPNEKIWKIRRECYQ